MVPRKSTQKRTPVPPSLMPLTLILALGRSVVDVEDGVEAEAIQTRTPPTMRPTVQVPSVRTPRKNPPKSLNRLRTTSSHEGHAAQPRRLRRKKKHLMGRDHLPLSRPRLLRPPRTSQSQNCHAFEGPCVGRQGLEPRTVNETSKSHCSGCHWHNWSPNA